MTQRRRSEGFDRIKPPERRLLERPDGKRLDDVSADPGGRAALFSEGALGRGRDRGDGHAGDAARARGGFGLAARCSRCEQTTTLSAGTALRAAMPLCLFLPWRQDPIFALCPACGHRAWMRLVEPSG